MEDYLEHYGTPQNYPFDPHGSGRYREGSGKDPDQHPTDLLARISELEKKYNGKETEVAKALGMSTTELRQRKSMAKEEQKAANIARVRRLKDHGCSNLEIERRTGIPESTVRNYLKEYATEKSNLTQNAVDKLKEELKTKTYLDVGSGAEIELGVSQSRLNTALRKLKDEGYLVDTIYVPQAGNPGKYTTVKILGSPDSVKKDIFEDLSQIKPVGEFHSTDNGITWQKLEPPASLDSSRVQIRYAEDGGELKDGVIEIRKGLKDLNLGDSQYAQVRIAVDGTHYLKGMAMYADAKSTKDMAPGVDVIFNTNKSKNTPMIATDDSGKEVLKRMKDDPENPFGALIKQAKYDKDGNLLKASGQYHYIGEDGKEHLSPINKVKEEGEWEEWSKNLASQFLSKQTYGLAKQQLDLTYKEQKEELNEIKSLTNETVKKQLLQEFADNCDSSAVHLKAAALPRQAYKVILPITGLSEKEIYAPTYRNGEEVALVRYPHGGTFEIPILRVNNNNKQAQSIIKNAPDAVGINAKVAVQLSGADFDGDTVLVIPTKGQKIKATQSLKGLKDFNPSTAYPGYDGMPVIKNKQTEMGIVSNLITDMTLQGATESELERAVKYSMVVIDSEKHKLNYKQCYKDMGIAALKKRYQEGGASTLISRATNEQRVPERRQNYHIDPKTGEKIWTETGRSYIKNGKTVYATTSTTQMAEAKDARALISKSNTRMENLYALHANNLKALANDARKTYMSIKEPPRNPSATKAYSDEVASLNDKLNEALRNAPRERQAQVRANAIYKEKLEKYDIPKSDQKKVKSQALATARSEVGAISRANRDINITDKEWEAIQAHAVSPNTLHKILANTDDSALKQRALPKSNKIPSSKIALIKALANSGYTQAEIADRVGLSVSSVSKAISGKA